MSLVREALAKAEREAAARAAREKGVAAPLSDAAQPYRARRQRARWPWWLALVVAAAGGATVAFFVLRPATRAAPEATSIASDAKRAPASVQPPAEPAATAPSAEVVAEAPSPKLAAAPTAPPAPAPAPASEASRPPTARSAASAEPIALPTASTDPRVLPSSDAEPLLAGTFVRRFALGNGRTIQLGGIAWSQAAPLAYLNGKLRGVGETVEGLRVAAIEPDRVLLEDGRLRYALTLR